MQRQEDEVDVDAIWNAIEPSVDEINREQKRKRRFIFWMCFVGLLAIGSSTVFYFSKNNKNQGVEENTLSVVQSTDSELFTHDDKLNERNVLDEYSTNDYQDQPVLPDENSMLPSNVTKSEVIVNELLQNEDFEKTSANTRKTIDAKKRKGEVDNNTITNGISSDIATNFEKKDQISSQEFPNRILPNEKNRENVDVLFLNKITNVILYENEVLALDENQRRFYFDGNGNGNDNDNSNENDNGRNNRFTSKKSKGFSLQIFGGASIVNRSLSSK
ncbi:MAG: hypothetical protein AAF573_11465, partial [Bacteroidota bacterium]